MLVSNIIINKKSVSFLRKFTTKGTKKHEEKKSLCFFVFVVVK